LDKEDWQTDDNEKYLLFSMEVTLPESDPTLLSVKERYYLRIDQKLPSQESTLQQGTITGIAFDRGHSDGISIRRRL
jgi:hypothetical protein